MHILIIGATGRNGAIVLQGSLSRSHTVTALARNPSSLPTHANLTTIEGTPSSESDLVRALTSPRFPDVVITTLNQRRVTESPFAALSSDSPPDLLTSAMKTLLLAIKSVNPTTPPKIVVNSSQGVGESIKSMNLALRFVFSHSTMRFALKDHENLDTILRDSGLNFVMARPCRLVEGSAMDVRVWPDDGKGSAWMPTITRESVGKWLVDAAEGTKWDGQAPVITN
ncbi:Fc.00g029180.m01.CDS01 [Cosmosporella sp. VM-42]